MADQHLLLTNNAEHWEFKKLEEKNIMYKIVTIQKGEIPAYVILWCN